MWDTRSGDFRLGTEIGKWQKSTYVTITTSKQKT